MFENYKIYPSAQIADSLIQGKNIEDTSLGFENDYQQNFLSRFKTLDDDLKFKIFTMYAAPLINKRRGQ